MGISISGPTSGGGGEPIPAGVLDIINVYNDSAPSIVNDGLTAVWSEIGMYRYVQPDFTDFDIGPASTGGNGFYLPSSGVWLITGRVGFTFGADDFDPGINYPTVSLAAGSALTVDIPIRRDEFASGRTINGLPVPAKIAQYDLAFEHGLADPDFPTLSLTLGVPIATANFSLDLIRLT